MVQQDRLFSFASKVHINHKHYINFNKRRAAPIRFRQFLLAGWSIPSAAAGSWLVDTFSSGRKLIGRYLQRWQEADWSIPSAVAGSGLVNNNEFSCLFTSRGQCDETWKLSKKGRPCWILFIKFYLYAQMKQEFPHINNALIGKYTPWRLILGFRLHVPLLSLIIRKLLTRLTSHSQANQEIKLFPLLQKRPRTEKIVHGRDWNTTNILTLIVNISTQKKCRRVKATTETERIWRVNSTIQ